MFNHQRLYPIPIDNTHIQILLFDPNVKAFVISPHLWSCILTHNFDGYVTSPCLFFRNSSWPLKCGLSTLTMSSSDLWYSTWYTVSADTAYRSTNSSLATRNCEVHDLRRTNHCWQSFSTDPFNLMWRIASNGLDTWGAYTVLSRDVDAWGWVKSMVV